ncbi:hypothetical protein ACJJTC_003645 [Scirpophaga incertulas]
MRLIYKPPRRMEHRVPARLAFAKLIHNEDTQQELDAGFGAAVSTADDNLATDAKWQNYADILHRVAQQVVGKPQKENQDWFDESDSEIRRLVERSRLALGGAIDARHRSSIKRDLKVKIRGIKDSWWRHKAEELQWLADTIYSRDKTKRLTDPAEVLLRWAEHFNEVLNPGGMGADLSYIGSLENLPIVTSLDDPPTLAEFNTGRKARTVFLLKFLNIADRISSPDCSIS